MGKYQTGGTGSEEENVDADWGVELVETVDGACCGLEEGGFFVGEVVNLVTLLLVTKREWVNDD